jgi:4-amino-4-deoxy-L-arabinose transferase-like glycosyltransferase
VSNTVHNAVPRSHFGRHNPIVVCGALLLACAVFMFVDRRTPPIIIWDESRLAVNALEMHLRGWSLVTTYGFSPDLWNTKPPLMIWLMKASMDAFGPAELSLRLPAMAAALGTIVIVFFFVRRVTRSLPTATLAVLLLATSVGFYGEHGARTGDYDALLCFFTTAYLSILYFAVHQRRPAWRMLLLAGILVAGATMTKTVAGLVPGVGVALYLLVSGRVYRAIASPRYVVMLLLALMPLTAFYLLREWLAPGFVEAAWYNDVSGRFRDHLAVQGGPPYYYVKTLFLDGLFSAGPLALLAPVGLAGSKGQTRRALIFALCCVVGQLLLVTVTATRLVQYILPALPWLAIACAITVKERLPRFLGFSESARPDWRRIILPSMLVAAAVTNIGIRTAVMRYDLLLERAFYPQASYGALLASLHDRGVRRVTVLEPGIEVSGITAYQPQLRYYALLWNRRGMMIERHGNLPGQTGQDTLASCDPGLSGLLLSRGGSSPDVPGCATNLPPRMNAGQLSAVRFSYTPSP